MDSLLSSAFKANGQRSVLACHCSGGAVTAAACSAWEADCLVADFAWMSGRIRSGKGNGAHLHARLLRQTVFSR